MAASLLPKLLRSRAFTSADADATTVAIEIPAGGYVPPRGVSVVVTTPLAGGTPSIDVGDADLYNGWVVQADVEPTTAGTYSGTTYETAEYADTGRYYSSGGQITVTLPSGVTDGEFFVVAQVCG